MVCIDDEIPFEIPESWQWCRIKHLFSMQAGKNIKAFELSDTPTSSHTYPCYGGNGLRGYVNHYNTEGNFILVGRQGALCGNVKEVKGKFYATEHAVVTNGYGLTNLQWAYYFLWALDLNQYATATAQPGLAVSNIIEVLIPLPPFEEQIRIASKIDNTLLYVDSFTKVQKDLEVLNNEVILNLRKSILQEAIQGKLVPQDPNEESASVLLQRIKEEKQRLVKEDKLKKKDVIDSTIFKGDDNKYYEEIGSEIACIDDIVPFDLPASWCWVRHNQLFEVSGGSQPPKSHFIDHYREGYIRLYQIRDYGSNPVPVYVPINEISKTTKKGDILLARYGGSLGKVFWAEEGAYNVAMAKVKPLYRSELIHKEYIFLYYCSNIYQSAIIDHSRSAQAGFNKDDLADMLFPLPPFAEQARIVERYKSIIASIMSK